MERSATAAARSADPWSAAFAALDVFLDRCCDPVYGKLVWREAKVGVFYTPTGGPYYTIFDLRPHAILVVDPSTIKGLPAGLHASAFNSPFAIPFVAAQVLRSLDGRVVLGDEGVGR